MLSYLAEHPDSGRIHLNDGGHPLRWSQTQHRHRAWLWDGISIQRNYLEAVACECNPMDLGRTGVEHMKQHTLALFDAHRLTETQHLAIDRRDVIHRAHKAIVSAFEVAFPIVQREKHLALIAGWVIAGLDHQETMLASKLSLAQVVSRKGV